MTFFTSAYKLLAHLAPNWDTQLRADMAFLETNLDQSSWAPGFGGTGATLGGSSGTNGRATRLGQTVIYQGRLAFGSSPSFGSGTPTITGFNSFGGNIDQTTTIGFGQYFKIAGGLPIPLTLASATPSSFAPYVTGNGALAGLGTISGAPAQSDQLIFTVIGQLA